MPITRLGRLRMLVCALLALLCAHCGGASELPSPASPAMSLSDGSDLDHEDVIESLDLAVEADGTLHLVWWERIGLYGSDSSPDRIVYRRGHGNPVQWDAPMIVAEGAVAAPQVVATSDGVHVFAGQSLKHWVLLAGGGQWRAEGELLGNDATRVGGFDAVAVDDAVVFAFVTDYTSEDPTVYSMRWRSDGGAAIPQAVAVVPPSQLSRRPAPKLLLQERRLLLLWGVNSLVADPKATVRTFHSEGHLYSAWSNDAGQHWSRPEEVTDGPGTYIAAIAVATGTTPEPVAFFTAHGLFASRLTDGTWASPVQLAAFYNPRALAGSAKTPVVAATQCGGGMAVAWVDGRYERSDKRWWNPLGGFPWSDSPDWINNDLFVFSGDDFAAAMDDPSVQPRRQTVPGSFTRDVAVAERDGELLLVWAGRAQVKKSPGDMHSPPRILQRTVSCG